MPCSSGPWPVPGRFLSLPTPIGTQSGPRTFRWTPTFAASRPGTLWRLRPFVDEGDPELGRIVARHLAVWMSYEDAVRVAELKTRMSRFERIRKETGARDGEIVVTDFLKPDLDEIYGVLPYRLVAWVA